MTQPLFVDPYSRNRLTGGLILIDEATNTTVGTVMITDATTSSRPLAGQAPSRAPPGEGATAGGSSLVHLGGRRGRSFPPGEMAVRSPMTRADLDKQPGRGGSAMFDALAGRYDLMNDVLVAGAGPAGGAADQWHPGRSGPGRGPGARPGGGHRDLVPDLRRGRRRRAWRATSPWACSRSGQAQAGRVRPGPQARHPGRARCAFAAGDALRLPFRDRAFDAVTISFGLRNVARHRGTRSRRCAG